MKARAPRSGGSVTGPRPRRANPLQAGEVRRAARAALMETLEERQLLTTAFAVTSTNNLIRFDTATPGSVISSAPIGGLAGGETVLGIDFRPATGELYALGSSSRLYKVNVSNAVATPVGAAGAFTLSGTEFGFDCNPTVDRIRVVSDTDQNLRLNPNDGTLAATDTPLAYAAADTNSAANPNAVGAAYTNSVNGATTTTLYDIDTNLDVLVTQNPPNAGTLNTVGSLGVNASSIAGFDIRDTDNAGFAVLQVGGVSSLYSINLTTGAATVIGGIGGAPTVRGFALAPAGFINTSLVGTVATFNGGPASDQISFDQSGGLLRHNRFSAGDSGFNSDFDFDPATPGDQTLSASDPAVTIIVNAGGADDQVTIGSLSAPAGGLSAVFQINGQGGGDSLVIEDSNDATLRNILLNGPVSGVSGVGGPITYGTLERLTLNAGNGADTINVVGTQPAMTNINAGGGNDSVVFGAGATLSGGIADGGSGSNTLDYSAYTSAVTVDLSANATQTAFQAILSGTQEAGPLSNSPASGILMGTLNAAQTALAFNISYQGLTGSPISGTHFHNQVSGVNGPIVRGLFPSEQNGLVTPSGNFAGVWSASDPTLTPPDPAAPGAPVRPLTAPSPVTPGSTLVQELLAGRIYFNIHTLPNFPSGEIRGQLFSQGSVNPATGTGGVRGFRDVFGGTAGDTLTGDNNANLLAGGNGDDTITGGQGGDTISGGANNDTIIWNNGDGSDIVDGDGGDDTLQINGSPAGDDQFLLQVNPGDASRLRFDRVNLGLFNLNIGTTEAIDINSLGGDDTTTIDFAGGNPIPANGINFDGGIGDEATPTADLLVLQRSAGSFVGTSEVHTATQPGAGTIGIDGRSITFFNLEPVNDTVPVTNFTFTAPPGSGAVNIVDGPNLSGTQTTQINSPTDAFELINFANKTNVTANTSAVANTVTINNPNPAVGLANLTVNGSPQADLFLVTPSSVPMTLNGDAPITAPGDQLVVDLTGTTDATLTPGAFGSGVYTFSDRAPIAFTGFESVSHPTPSITIDDVSLTEGNAGQKAFNFTVTRSGDLAEASSVDYFTSQGSALADNDYQSAAGTLSFLPGQATRTITVYVNGDKTFESDQTFFVNLVSPHNAILADDQAEGTIENDDAAPPPSSPTIIVNDPSVSEGNSGLKNLTFTVKLTKTSTKTITVKYTTAPGSATPGVDYLSKSGTLTFSAGQLSKTVSAQVKGDTTLEPNETVLLVLSDATNAKLSQGVGIGRILNDDKPAISIGNASVVEGNSGTKLLTFTVTLSQPTTNTVTVNYKTSDGSAKTSDNDYVSKTGVLTFSSGQTSRTISITVKGDTKHEGNETFNVQLFNPFNAFLSDATGVGTISNND